MFSSFEKREAHKCLHEMRMYAFLWMIATMRARGHRWKRAHFHRVSPPVRSNHSLIVCIILAISAWYESTNCMANSRPRVWLPGLATLCLSRVGSVPLPAITPDCYLHYPRDYSIHYVMLSAFECSSTEETARSKLPCHSFSEGYSRVNRISKWPKTTLKVEHLPFSAQFTCHQDCLSEWPPMWNILQEDH